MLRKVVTRTHLETMTIIPIYLISFSFYEAYTNILTILIIVHFYKGRSHKSWDAGSGAYGLHTFSFSLQDREKMKKEKRNRAHGESLQTGSFLFGCHFCCYTQYSAETERHRIIPQTRAYGPFAKTVRAYIYSLQNIKKKEKQNSLNNEINVTLFQKKKVKHLYWDPSAYCMLDYDYYNANYSVYVHVYYTGAYI